MVIETGAIVALLKDPLKMVKSLYAWCGWVASALAIASVWLTERPTDVAARVFGKQIDFVPLRFEVGGESAAQSAVVVSCVVLLALPVFATLKTGWDDIADAQILVWRRAGPPVVTFWLLMLVAAERGPLGPSRLGDMFESAVAILWDWSEPLVLFVVGVSVVVHVLWFVLRRYVEGAPFRTAVDMIWRALSSFLTTTYLMAFAVCLTPCLPLIALMLFMVGLGDDHDQAPGPLETRRAGRS